MVAYIDGAGQAMERAMNQLKPGRTMADYEKHLNEQLSDLSWDQVRERFRKCAVTEYRLVIMHRDKRLGSWIRKNKITEFREGYKAWRNL